MPWSGGTFNRANGATGWADDQAANIGIEATRHDTQDNDFRDGINQTLNKDGQNTPTANLPMGGFRHTGASDAVGDADYTTYGQAKAGVNIAKASTVDHTISQYTTTTAGATVAFQKSRGASVGTNTIVNNGDTVGNIVFRGANGTTFSDAAKISAVIDGAPGATTDMPGALVFSTSADASATPTERMRIDSGGRVGINNQTPGAGLDIRGTGTDGLSNIAQFRFDSSNNPPAFRQYRSTSATLGTITAVASGDNLGIWEARGADGTDYPISTRILSRCTAAVSTGIVPGAIILQTADTSGVLNDRLSVVETGIVRMNAYGAGTATFSASGTISSTSDERLKIKDGSIVDPIAKLQALNPGYWFWKPEVAEQFGPQRELGFFAQNVNAAIGEEAAPTPIDDKPWGYYDRSVLAVTVEALKAALQKIGELEDRIALLEGA